MELNYQNSVEDFKVHYTLIRPDDLASGYSLSAEEQNFLNELNETYAEIERLTNFADGYDYAIAVSSGIITGLMDSIFVGAWNFRNAKKQSYIAANNIVINFAKKHHNYEDWCNGKGKTGRWIKRDPNRLLSAVEFLEEKYKLPGDSEWNFKNSGISASTHRLDDFCHHPTLVGLICCILVQFTGNAKYHPSTGDVVSVPVTVNEYGKFVSDSFFGKIFSGIINWFFIAAETIKKQKGHLISDMAGSISSVKKGNIGVGIPGTLMSTLKEISALPCFKDISFAENLRKAFVNGIGNGNNQLDLGILNNLFKGAKSKFDMRTEMAIKHELKRQSIPVILNEIIVRSFYFIRRFIEQMNCLQSIMDIDWKKLIPANNRTITRMMTIASGTFCILDLMDAGVRTKFTSFFILRVNFVGIGRFAIAVGDDLYMEARKNRLDLAVTSGEIAVTALEEKKIIVESSNIKRSTDEKIKNLKKSSSDLERILNIK